MYVDNINKNNGYYALSAFNNVLICSNAIDANKTVTFPSGYNLDTNLSFNVVFVNGHNCANSSDNLTLNDVLVVANKNGTLIPLPIHAMDDGLGGTVYKSLQANTVLNLYYTSNYDGSNTPAFVIIGNPIVLSSSDYTIYADGYNETKNPTRYPDYERGSLYTTQVKSYTLTEDCWVEYTYSFTPTTDTASILINGQNYCTSDYWSNAGISTFNGFVKKGSIITKINNSDISINALKVFGLK